MRPTVQEIKELVDLTEQKGVCVKSLDKVW